MNRQNQSTGHWLSGILASRPTAGRGRGWLRGVALFMTAGVLLASAQTDTAESAGVDDGGAAPAPAIDEPRLRDPFWPVGYEPPPEPVEGEDDGLEPTKDPEPEIEPADWAAAGQMLNFQGTFRTWGRDLASVNGQIVEEGDVIGVRRAPWIYHWRVIEIEQTGIKTTPIEAIPIE